MHTQHLTVQVVLTVVLVRSIKKPIQKWKVVKGQVWKLIMQSIMDALLSQSARVLNKNQEAEEVMLQLHQKEIIGLLSS